MGGIERGEHNLALVNILKITTALGLQPSEFFKALDTPKNEKIKTPCLTPAKPAPPGQGVPVLLPLVVKVSVA